jgi:chromosome segregation ATPase
MISEIYLKRALRIRTEYLSIVNDIKTYENLYIELVAAIERTMKDSKSLLDDINAKKISNIDSAQKELANIMNSLELDANKIDKSITDLNKKIEKLSISEVELYSDIKSKYDLSDDIIRSNISDYFKKMNID